MKFLGVLLETTAADRCDNQMCSCMPFTSFIAILWVYELQARSVFVNFSQQSYTFERISLIQL